VPVSDGVVALRVRTASRCGAAPGGAPNEILALDERLYVGSKDTFFYCLMTGRRHRLAMADRR
jgi:hypothetical protein